MYFVCKGFYKIGYEINKTIKYKLLFGPRTVIGGFAIAFNQRHNYFYRSQSFLQAFSIRRRNWKALVNEYESFMNSIKINFNYNYI